MAAMRATLAVALGLMGVLGTFGEDNVCTCNVDGQTVGAAATGDSCTATANICASCGPGYQLNIDDYQCVAECACVDGQKPWLTHCGSDVQEPPCNFCDSDLVLDTDGECKASINVDLYLIGDPDAVIGSIAVSASADLNALVDAKFTSLVDANYGAVVDFWLTDSTSDDGIKITNAASVTAGEFAQITSGKIFVQASKTVDLYLIGDDVNKIGEGITVSAGDTFAKFVVDSSTYGVVQGYSLTNEDNAIIEETADITAEVYGSIGDKIFVQASKTVDLYLIGDDTTAISSSIEVIAGDFTKLETQVLEKYGAVKGFWLTDSTSSGGTKIADANMDVTADVYGQIDGGIFVQASKTVKLHLIGADASDVDVKIEVSAHDNFATLKGLVEGLDSDYFADATGTAFWLKDADGPIKIADATTSVAVSVYEQIEDEIFVQVTSEAQAKCEQGKLICTPPADLFPIQYQVKGLEGCDEEKTVHADHLVSWVFDPLTSCNVQAGSEDTDSAGLQFHPHVATLEPVQKGGVNYWYPEVICKCEVYVEGQHYVGVAIVGAPTALEVEGDKVSMELLARLFTDPGYSEELEAGDDFPSEQSRVYMDVQDETSQKFPLYLKSVIVSSGATVGNGDDVPLVTDFCSVNGNSAVTIPDMPAGSEHFARMSFQKFTYGGGPDIYIHIVVRRCLSSSDANCGKCEAGDDGDRRLENKVEEDEFDEATATRKVTFESKADETPADPVEETSGTCSIRRWSIGIAVSFALLTGGM